MRKLFLIAGFCVALSGCAGFQAIEGNEPVIIGGDITLVPQVAWSQATAPANYGQLWTIDGIGLNELRFYTAITSTRPLMVIPGVQFRDLPKYDATMLPNDVVDFFVGTMDRAGHQQIRTDALRPAPFGPVTGFRFDFSYATQDGLLMKGMVLAVQRAEKLDFIMFTAPAEYYFDRYAPTVEQIFASVRVPSPVQARAS